MNSTMKVKFDWNKNMSTTSVPSGSAASMSLSNPQSFVPGTVVTNAASIAAIRPNSFMQHLDVNDSNSNNSLTGVDNLALGSSASALNMGRSTFGIASSSNSVPGNQTCCLADAGIKCNRPASNASYNKRIQKTVAQKKLNLVVDKAARHIYICEHHKGLIQNNRVPPMSGKRKRKEIELDDLDFNDRDSNDYDYGTEDVGRGGGDGPQIDLGSLPVNALRRYKKHFHVQSRPGINKPQLADQLSRHLRSIPIIEKEAITYFIYMVKLNKNKLDKVDPKSVAATATYLDSN